MKAANISLESSPTSETSNPPSIAGIPQKIEKRTNEIHLVLQGKGGVGKSFVATLLAEYFQDKFTDLRCYDTDPVNPTFSSYKAFGAKRMPIVVDGKLNEPAFDELLLELMDPGVSAVVDSGATTFVALMRYLERQDAFKNLAKLGKQVVVHSIVVGGDAMAETAAGFARVVDTTPESTRIVLWLNQYRAPVALNGVPFTESDGYKAVQARVSSVIDMPESWGDLFDRDIQEMRQLRMSFNEAIAGESRPGIGTPFNILQRQRFTLVQRDYFDKLWSFKV
ncbi:P-loop NTPase family protein [Acidocella aminolytica]|uniref:conjugal transfer protein TraL n=1 Tax=Acidocella aminolytica TaxID=33998 RepID=UPI0011150480|nr:conjugal transfer protein TraL [Acidocella aminolytica]GBQ34866.1 conjugal transfer protein TraL [Acidocella aminolytica 101 = DSM 11237]